MLATRILRTLVLLAALLVGATNLACAQAPAAPMAAELPAPPTPTKLLVKAGMRLTHLFYLPGNQQSWQLVLPSSFGVEYRLQSHWSLYAQAEADISAGRAQRGRRGRGAAALPMPTTDLSVGVRSYLNPPAAANPWGNYLALEGTTELTQITLRGAGRGRRGAGAARLTPGVFALCGTQHRGPGRRWLYDLNAGLGIQVPPPYRADATVRPPWDVAAQVNLRVYFVNQPHSPQRSRH